MKLMKSQNKAPYPELRGSIDSVRYPAFVEPKRDGEYCICYLSDGVAFLLNKHGTIRKECQITYQIETYFKREKHLQVCLIGELCWCFGLNGDLYNLLSNKTNEDVLRYYIFDIKSLNGEDLKDRSLIDRREILEELFDGFRSSSISLNPVMLVVDKDELKTAYEKCINGHFEGAVVKSLDSHLVFGPCSWVKIKHKDQSDFEVMSIDPVKERVEVKVKTPHGERLVGVKVSDAEKRSIHVGDMIAIEHQGILNGGGLRHPVFKGLAKEEVK